MIVIKVCIWPGGDHTKERIQTMGALALDPTSKPGKRSYKVWLLKNARYMKDPKGYDPDRVRTPPSRNVWKRGRVFRHNPNTRGSWDLIGAALKFMLGNRLNLYDTEDRER